MTILNQLKSRLAALFGKHDLDADMTDEMRAHIEMRTQKNVEAGMNPEEARFAALRQFGWTESIKETCREQRGIGWLENLGQDLRFGARQLRKNPGFTAVAVLTLALGIGANTAIFTVLNAVLLRPLPYENPGQLVRLWSDMSGRRTDQNSFCPAEITDLRERLTAFEDLGAFDVGLSANLTSGTQPERVNCSEASPGLFTSLRVKPLLGRTFLPSETDVAQSRVALMSEGLWKRRFGGDPTLAGRTVQLDGVGFTVVGVLPGGFNIPEEVDLWLPFSFTAADWKNDRSHYYVDVVGRLKTGVSLLQATGELEAVARRLGAHAPEDRKRWGVWPVSLHEQMVGRVRPALWIVFGVVNCVLLIACVNVAGLLLTRAAARQKEMTLRAALGAGWLRLVRQLMTEVALLGLMGGGAGVLLAAFLVKAFSVSAFNTLPQVEGLSVSPAVLGFTLLVSLLTGAICGVAPALRAANPNLNEALKEGGRCVSGPRGTLRNYLVAAEVALSIVLLVGGGLLVNSFLRLRSVKTGFDPGHLLTMQVTLPKTQYPDTERQNAFLRLALEKISALPGVTSAAATINLPLLRAWEMGYWVLNHENTPNQMADNAYVTPNYFTAMGIPMLKGRDFSEGDSADRPPVIIISAELARRHFPKENPVGQRINVGADREIVGVVADVKPRGLEVEAEPQIYLPYAQKLSTAGFATFTIRSEAKPFAVARVCEQAITAVDRNLPVANIRSMEQIVSASLTPRRLTMILLSAFAAVAVMLASIGIYGLVAYSVTQRARELGIRMALGAQRGQVFALIVGQGMRVVLLGVAAGLITAFVLTRLMRTLLFGIRPSDPLTFGCVSLIFAAVALLACWLPARRAAKVDPMEALRAE